ncbi:MAG: single-stranded DNA-binding protein [Evtepia gabavorous]|uniref:single-stranded DNA-binding protein n=1 Tax=Evtepia gabavorous TaxID=2211183 RepID=UPI00399F5C9F
MADPELRHTQNGVAVASFRLAVDRDFKDRETGERKADFINVVAWRQTGEFVSRFLTKGRLAVVEGTPDPRLHRPGRQPPVRHGSGGRQRLFRRFPPGWRRRLHTRPPGWPEQRLRCPRRQQQLPPLRRRLHRGPCGGSVC